MFGASSFRLRRYLDSDAQPLARIRAEAAAEAGIDADSTLGPPPTAEEFRSIVADSNESTCVVSELDGVPVGYSTLSMWQESSGVTVFLVGGYVAATARSQGIATAMLEHMEQLARSSARYSGVYDDAVLGANASTHESDRIAFLNNCGYQAAFSMVEMQLMNLSTLDAVTGWAPILASGRSSGAASASSAS